MNVFDRLEDEIICHANDDNYKESYALFKIGDVEEMIDSYRCLQFKKNKAIEYIEENGYNVSNNILLDILKEAENVENN